MARQMNGGTTGIAGTKTGTRRRRAGAKRGATSMQRQRQSGLGNVTFTGQQVAYLLTHEITVGTRGRRA